MTLSSKAGVVLKISMEWLFVACSLLYPFIKSDIFCKQANEKSDTKYENSSNKRDTSDKIEKTENKQRK